MIVGYARLSEHEPPSDLEWQRAQLIAAGCTKHFIDRCLPRGSKLELAAALAFLREGDCLVVARPDRLAFRVSMLVKHIDELGKRGIGLVVLSAPKLDTRDPASAATIATLRAVTKWQAAHMAEMRRVGILKAQAAGRYKGGQFKVSTTEVRELAANGMRPGKIARLLKISRNTVWVHLGKGYRVTPAVKPERRPRIDARTVQVLSMSLPPGEVAKAMNISTSSVRNLRGW